jgi:glutamate dehydrogenase
LAAHRELLRELASPGRALRTDDAYRWLLGLGRVLERTTRWILQAVSPDVPTGEVISANESGLLTLRRHFHEIVAGADRDAFQIRVDELVEMGAERPFARQLITLRFLDQLLEILRVAHDTGADALETGRAFYRISELLSVSWLREAIFQAAQIDRWEQRAAQALADDLSRAHHRLVAQVMRSGGAGPDVGETALRLLEHRQRELDRYRRLLDEIRGEGRMTLSGLSVAVREMSLFAERTATV